MFHRRLKVLRFMIDHDIHSGQITLMLKWAACLLINVSFAALWTMSSTGTAGTKIRKIFHLGISAVFVIGIKEDVELLSFCSACLLIVLIMLEVSIAYASWTHLINIYSSVLADLQVMATFWRPGEMCFGFQRRKGRRYSDDNTHLFADRMCTATVAVASRKQGFPRHLQWRNFCRIW